MNLCPVDGKKANLTPLAELGHELNAAFRARLTRVAYKAAADAIEQMANKMAEDD